MVQSWYLIQMCTNIVFNYDIYYIYYLGYNFFKGREIYERQNLCWRKDYEYIK